MNDIENDTNEKITVKLTLRSLPMRDCSGQTSPASNRLRQLLKAALRSYGYRCIRVENVMAIEGAPLCLNADEAGDGCS